MKWLEYGISAKYNEQDEVITIVCPLEKPVDHWHSKDTPQQTVLYKLSQKVFQAYLLKVQLN